MRLGQLLDHGQHERVADELEQQRAPARRTAHVDLGPRRPSPQSTAVGAAASRSVGTVDVSTGSLPAMSPLGRMAATVASSVRLKSRTG
ncbi:hypothetical protein P8C59_001330 [Phyllachora maydis]|uniref:Uncharacterized protein n=1 Tax=Phyllachora maydis TaxID=1825666 RepID=A0AAD9M8Y4_9PEZI|nr:hypothetical protein P8C59_001330 [Phyllachora maydis]